VSASPAYRRYVIRLNEVGAITSSWRVTSLDSWRCLGESRSNASLRRLDDHPVVGDGPRSHRCSARLGAAFTVRPALRGGRRPGRAAAVRRSAASMTAWLAAWSWGTAPARSRGAPVLQVFC